MADNSKDGAIDTSAAEAFEKYLVPTIFGPWSEAMIDHAGTKESHNLLDVGCGSGAAARYAAKIVGLTGSVSAIDFNAGMIHKLHGQCARASTPLYSLSGSPCRVVSAHVGALLLVSARTVFHMLGEIVIGDSTRS